MVVVFMGLTWWWSFPAILCCRSFCIVFCLCAIKKKNSCYSFASLNNLEKIFSCLWILTRKHTVEWNLMYALCARKRSYIVQAFHLICGYIGVISLIHVNIVAKHSSREETGMTMFVNTQEKGHFHVSIARSLFEREPCGLNIQGEWKQWYYLICWYVY